MKKTLFLLVSVTSFGISLAQEVPFNSWSVEANFGQNKAVKPFADNYYSSDPTKYFNFSDVNHFDVGVRYMFSTKFGLKLDFASDEVKNQKGNLSLDFKTQQYRLGLQGVANLGRIMAFETFTNRFGLLGHAGIQVSQLTSKMGVTKDVSEDNGGVIVGFTPQVRITNWLVATADFSVLSNLRQHLNWDGSYADSDNNLSGTMYNTSIGLTAYLGKNEKHADWYLVDDLIKSKDDELREKLLNIEKMLEDTDRDGVPDYLDAENNTPTGLPVDTKGRYVMTPQSNGNDQLVNGDNTANINSPFSKDNASKSLIEKGYVNVFFDVDNDTPNAGSSSNIYYMVQFLSQNPNAKAKLVGYADPRGDNSENLDLSKRRAKSVYDILVKSGINTSRISIEGHGVDTTYPSDSKVGLDLARRVSIILD